MVSGLFGYESNGGLYPTCTRCRQTILRPGASPTGHPNESVCRCGQLQNVPSETLAERQRRALGLSVEATDKQRS
jgi:hypothetical protein